MALSGTNVVFPYVASGLSGVAWWESMRSQEDYATPYMVQGQASATPQPLVGKWNNANFAFFAIDAGYQGDDSRRIPSGSIITDVRIKVQKGIDWTAGMEWDQDQGNVVVDACLTKRDGYWNAAPGVEDQTPISGGDLGVSEGYEGFRMFHVIRTPANTNIARSVDNNAIENPWTWWASRRHNVSGAHLNEVMDTIVCPGVSGQTYTAGKLVCRWRKFGSNPTGGPYYAWMELWRAAADDGSDDRPVQFLGTTWGSKISATSITTATNGIAYILDLDSSVTISGTVRYVVKSLNDYPITISTKYIGTGVKGIPTASQFMVGTSLAGGLRRWFTDAVYAMRTYVPRLYQSWLEGSDVIDHAPVGDFIASGLTGPTYGAVSGDWIELSGANKPFLVSALQAWIDDPLYTTSGDGAIFCLQLASQDDYTTKYGIPVSGIQVLVSWEQPAGPPPAPDRDWFDPRSAQVWHDARGAQNWHNARGAQNWHTSQGDRDWFDSWED